LGTFKSGEFLPEIEKSIVTLNENQVSGVLRGPTGFHIVKLLSKKNVMDPEFLKVKESIKAALVQQNFERQLKNWFELKKLDSNLKVYENAVE
jgi:peptidyl-prolyl cis-trans isomerase SurA